MTKLKICSVVFTVLTAGLPFTLSAQNWKMQPVSIQSRWAKEVSPVNALKEYPRPQMVRSNWTNLNGLWDYAITAKGAARPSTWEGQILVPYPLESALSGVKKSLLPSQNLWYKRSFVAPVLKSGERLRLNFGAVDYEASVYVNGALLGSHAGGYTEFSFDVTPALRSGENEIVVKVFDPSGEGVGPHGKQVLKPENIYYTPSSGIWQTVWMEVVPTANIKSFKLTPDIDRGVLRLKGNVPAGYSIQAMVLDERAVLSKVSGRAGIELIIPVKNAKLWTPARPFLYDLVIQLKKGNAVVDEVKSYFGMRKISVAKDTAGVDRIMLNNKPYFNIGTLDQGFWPEGLYTAATDEALAFDIKAIKAMGFNTIRKHIKVEPARWYYHADKLGMLVWQDLVNPNQDLPEGAKEAFEKGSAEEIAQLYNYPSIVTWVLFNEKWGQYDQRRLTSWLKAADPSRIVNGHSGELLYVNEVLRSPSPDAYVGADMTDVHAYPDPMNSLKLPGKAQVVGEFGGIGVFIPGHQWNPGSQWGYVQEKPAGLKAKYTIMNQHLKIFEAEGMSGSIYTQPFDVESEQNGLMTYDREVVKIPFAELRKIHSPLNTDMGNIPEVTAQDADLSEPGVLYSAELAQYVSGKKDPAFLKRLAMMSGQTGDKAGSARFSSEYLATLVEPYSPEDIAFMESMTKKVTDKGFSVLVKRAATDRTAQVKAMNIIFSDVIMPYVTTPDAKPDWDEIEQKVQPFGTPGEEMLLRAKTIHTMNQQNWDLFIPTAKLYMEKYAAHISEQEKKLFQKSLEEQAKP